VLLNVHVGTRRKRVAETNARSGPRLGSADVVSIALRIANAILRVKIVLI
jgi:hypothetical protein